MRVLVVNAGSSTLKLAVLDERDQRVSSHTLPAPAGQVDERGLIDAIAEHDIAAVGHRIVHGGVEFTAPVIIDDHIRRRLEALNDLAPLHQRRSLDILDLVTQQFPSLPTVACFDTAFHARLPVAASTYALPAEWRRRWNLRRFGFHGLSHAYTSRRAAELLNRDVASVRVVTCHLGAGASLAAVHGGVSVDTTMGFTPLEGLTMATRCGSVDPGLILWLEEHAHMRASELSAALAHRSGLLGLAGSADMKAVLEAEAVDDPDAALAIAVYLHRLRASIAAMTASMGGLDALVFSGGVGERSAVIRERATDGLDFLGIMLDPAMNQSAVPDQELSAHEATVRSFIIEAREDLEIAAAVRRTLGRSP